MLYVQTGIHKSLYYSASMDGVRSLECLALINQLKRKRRRQTGEVSGDRLCSIAIFWPILMNKRDSDALAVCLSKVLQISSSESVLIWLKEAGWLDALEAQKLPVHEARYCCQMLEW